MRGLGLGVVALVLAGCGRPAERPSVAAVTPPTAAPSPAASTPEVVSAAVPEVAPPVATGCPEDMVLVAGNYCPVPQQICLEYAKDWVSESRRLQDLAAHGEKGKTNSSSRCLRYKQPSKCMSKTREPMRFCVDRYEWPNKQGELPALLVNWRDAKQQCEAIGKRLCTEREFNFACEGEDMLPYSFGYDRDPEKCHLDKPYRKRELQLKHYDRCMADPACKAHLEMLDQREPAGSRPECHSVFGVYDINGNVNEWVELPGEQPPNRSGLKGGWWGPVRSRCRPTVTFHKEEDYGYEVGFRCCRDASP